MKSNQPSNPWSWFVLFSTKTACDVLDQLELPSKAKSMLLHDVTDDRQLGIDHSRSDYRVAGFLEVLFPDEASLLSARTECEQLTRAVQDIDPSAIVLVCEKNIVVSHAGSGIKRMSLLGRLSSITPAQFEHEWTGKHARDVPHLPHLLGYSQNIVREGAENTSPTIDGIVELWFPSPDHIVEAFASDQARITQTHALDFIETITTFLVTPREVGH